MTVDEYLAWVEGQPGRYELLDGVVLAMSPEGADHAEKKAAIHAALLAGIRARGLAWHALPDGMTVRIDDVTAYEPDALVYCGSKLLPSAVDTILTRIVNEGSIRLDPPGLEFSMADIYSDPPSSLARA
jgi:Uma2 family endonuclease